MASAPSTAVANQLFDDEAMRQLLHTIEAIVLTLTIRGEIEDCNDTCEQVGGFSDDELIGRHVASAFAVQNELELFQEKIAQLAAGEPLDKFESYLLTKHGDRKRIRWSGVCLDPGGDAPRTLLLTGIDITGEHSAREQLAKSEETAAKLQQKLIRLNAKYNLSDETSVDRRSERRLYFPREQRIAPMDGGVLPRPSEFITVKCRNIGARGLAFFLDRPPSSREFVVELGTGASAIYLTAEVKHATLAKTADSERYLVGCKYTGRVTI